VATDVKLTTVSQEFAEMCDADGREITQWEAKESFHARLPGCCCFLISSEIMGFPVDRSFPTDL
jgi:hypothetical protein